MIAGGRAGGRGRTTAVGAELQRGGKQSLRRVAEFAGEIIRHLTAWRPDAERRRRIVGCEAIRIVAEGLVVRGLELDGVVGLAAIVLWVETEGLAAGGRADDVDLEVDAAQPVDHRFARAAGVGRGQHEDAADRERRQGLVGREDVPETDGLVVERRRVVGLSRHRVDGARRGVEAQPRKCTISGPGRAGDHVRELRGHSKQATAVVAQVEDEVGHAVDPHFGDRLDDRAFTLEGTEGVEEDVPDLARRCVDDARPVNGARRQIDRGECHGAVSRRTRVTDDKSGRGPGCRREQRGIQLVHLVLRITVHEVDTVDAQEA